MKEKVKKMNANDAAQKAAANEKRLATMRATLTALEKAADAILAKGDAMTKADRLALLQLINIAYHCSGKIEGCQSIDSCASCEFCQKMMAAAIENLLMICGSCYAAADAWKEAAWRRHNLNARIFSTVLFEKDELQTLKVADGLCRYNEDGDTVNETMARNYLRIAAVFPDTSFGYWYKNTAAVSAGLQAEGIRTRAELPHNIRFIHSSPLIGFPAKETWFDDAIFTVYPDAETTAAAIAAGSWECNGRRCRACGYHCYKMQRTETVLQIAEVLRCSSKKRAEILAAYKARKAQQPAA